MKKKEIKYVGKLADAALEVLRLKHGEIYTMTIPVDDLGTEVAVGYFKKVDRQIMGASLSISDPIVSKQIILESTFIDGDRRILDEDDLFFSACMLVDEMLTFRKGELKKN